MLPAEEFMKWINLLTRLESYDKINPSDSDIKEMEAIRASIRELYSILKPKRKLRVIK